MIHNLSMWTARDKSLSFDQLKAEAGKAQKDQHLVIFTLLYFCDVFIYKFEGFAHCLHYCQKV